MEDQSVDTILGIGGLKACSQFTNLATTLSPDCGVEETVSIADASQYSNESQSISTDEEPKLPILRKLSDVSDKIQSLRNVCTTFSSEVKDMRNNLLNTLQELSKNHEVLMRRYIEEYEENKRLYNELIELKRLYNEVDEDVDDDDDDEDEDEEDVEDDDVDDDVDDDDDDDDDDDEEEEEEDVNVDERSFTMEGTDRNRENFYNGRDAT